MFDTYSKVCHDVSTVAFLHPETLPTWPDIVRQSRNADIEVRLYKAFSEGSLVLFASGLTSRFLSWQLNLRHRLVRWVRVHRHYLPLKHHSPVHR